MLLSEYFGLAFDTKLSFKEYWHWGLHFLLLGYIHDIVFNLGHRLLHTDVGYRWGKHYIHHRSNGGTAAASMYMAPIDFIVEIILPYWGYLVITLCLSGVAPWFQSDIRFNILVSTIGSCTAAYEHSGYRFVEMSMLDTIPHISHHYADKKKSFSEGIGSPGIMDALLGTETCGKTW